MEVYILDDNLRRVSVIDQFESLIWTERYSSIGDFELVIYASRQAKDLLTTDTLIAINTSYRVMRIDTVEHKETSDGLKTLLVKGVSIESQLMDRVAKHTMDGMEEDPEWVIQGTPGDIARHIFNEICVEGTLSPLDIIPFIQMNPPPNEVFPEWDRFQTWDQVVDTVWDTSGDLVWDSGLVLPPDTIPEPSEVITMGISPGSVYDLVKEICDIYGMGFRLIRNFDRSELFFHVYTGSDRTTKHPI